jgi:programmed cell death 6-interacting protein
LDQEAIEDETFRASHPITAGNHSREHPPSHEANIHLINKSKTYRESLNKALESNANISDKIDEYDDDISLLSLPQVHQIHFLLGSV